MEVLEPSCIGGPDLEVIGVSRVLDIERLAGLGNRLDSLSDLVEVELLSASVGSRLKVKVSATLNFKDSAHWELGDKIELSTLVESEVGVVSLHLLLLH